MYDFEKDYIIVKTLGSGTDGIVYLATSMSDSIQVAIKIIKKVAKREIDILLRIGKLQGICELLEWREETDHLVLIMEYMKNSMDLFEYVHIRKRLDEENSLNIFRNLLKIVKNLKDINVYHCDLKLENIMIQLDTFQLRLIDFNRAVMVSDDEAHEKYTGTLDYCPPEWFLTSKCQAEPATVWSLGIILYELLKGKVPFVGKDNIIYDDIDEKIESFSDFTKYLLRRMLNKDPELRCRLDDL